MKYYVLCFFMCTLDITTRQQHSGLKRKADADVP